MPACPRALLALLWAQAVAVKLTGERKTSQADFVGALSRLVEEASKSHALFDGTTVHELVGHLLRVITGAPPKLAQLYWSIVTALASQAEYFRAVGREAAQARCKQLADFAWATLLPNAGGAPAPFRPPRARLERIAHAIANEGHVAPCRACTSPC